MEKICVKNENPSDNEESVINEEKLFLRSHFKIEPSDGELEGIGHEFILPDIEYEHQIKEEATGVPEVSLGRDGCVANSDSDAQNSPSASSTTTSNVTKPINTASSTKSLLQAVRAPSQPVFQPPVAPVTAQTAILLPPPLPQHESQAETQAATQPNCTTTSQTVAPGQQTMSNVPTPAEEALRQCLQQAGANASIVVCMSPNGLPSIIASNEQLQLLLQQVQLQQAQAQAQVQLQPQLQLQQAQDQLQIPPQVQLQQAQAQVQRLLQQIQLQQAQTQLQAQLELQQAQAQMQLQPQVQLSQAHAQVQHVVQTGTVPVAVPAVSRASQNVLRTYLPRRKRPTSAAADPLIPTSTLPNGLGAQIATPSSGGSTNIGAPTLKVTAITSSFMNTVQPPEDQIDPSKNTQPIEAESTLIQPEFVSCSQPDYFMKGHIPTPCPDDEVKREVNDEWDDSSRESDAYYQMPLDDEVENESESYSSENAERSGDDDMGDSDWIPGNEANIRDDSRHGHHRRRHKHTNGDVVIDWQRVDGTETALPKLPFQPSRKGFLPPAVHPKQEIDYFQLFFSDELIGAMAAETNRYAASKIIACSPLTQFSQWKDWKDVTVEEMKAFFGFIMNMALSHKPQLSDYFSLEWTVKQDFFTDVFSRQRFFQIFRALHLAGPRTSTEPGRNSRSSKVENMWKYIDAASRKYFAPDEDIVLDVSTVGVKGRIEFKCRNLRKAFNRGLKIYVVKDCKTGFICALEPYFGQPTMNDLIRPDLPFTARIVVHLLSRILEEHPADGHHVFMDKFFTSVTLAKELQKMNTYVTGTVTPNRKGMPLEVRERYLKKMGSGVVLSFSYDGIVVVALADRCPVVMLSTYHGNCARRGPDSKEDTPKPDVMKDFSAKMGAIGKADHLCPAYEFSIRSHAWWRKLFFWLLEISVINSYCLFNLENRCQGLKSVNHVVFRKNLIRQLVGNVRNEPVRKRRRESAHVFERLNNTFHCVGLSKNSRDCVVCSDRSKRGGGRRKQTKYICSTCSVNPALHVPVCFNKYHSEQTYR